MLGIVLALGLVGSGPEYQISRGYVVTAAPAPAAPPAKGGCDCNLGKACDCSYGSCKCRNCPWHCVPPVTKPAVPVPPPAVMATPAAPLAPRAPAPQPLWPVMPAARPAAPQTYYYYQPRQRPRQLFQRAQPRQYCVNGQCYRY
jgi:hypothetical protein